MTDRTEVTNAEARVHTYSTTCSWRGSTGNGYEHYQRTHAALAPPATTNIDLSADPAFHGNSDQLNPEQLVVIAASSCQLLSFLAVAARARIDIVAYHDEAQGVMPENHAPIRLTEIRLRPHITVSGDASHERILHLVEVAHSECYVANSLRSIITVDATIERRS